MSWVRLVYLIISLYYYLIIWHYVLLLWVLEFSDSVLFPYIFLFNFYSHPISFNSIYGVTFTFGKAPFYVFLSSFRNIGTSDRGHHGT